MSDDRVWICCNECGECTCLFKWGLSGATESYDIGDFIDEHVVVHGRAAPEFPLNLFALTTDDGVVLGKTTRRGSPQEGDNR